MVNLTEVFDGAKLIGWKESKYDYPKICVWYGGYGFNVYGANNFGEVDYFSSGELAGDIDGEEAVSVAKSRIKSEGYEVIES